MYDTDTDSGEIYGLPGMAKALAWATEYVGVRAIGVEVGGDVFPIDGKTIVIEGDLYRVVDKKRTATVAVNGKKFPVRRHKDDPLWHLDNWHNDYIIDWSQH